jgi:hypothetical protein
VDVALLAGAQSDLRDLRLFDAQQREVGYLLVRQEQAPRWIPARVLPIAATKTTSGFEADLGRATRIDRIELEGIARPFLKRATLEGSGDRARWTLLADTTVFDLPEQELRHTEVAFEAGEYRYLRVVWDDRASARVQSLGGVRARVSDSAAPPEPMRFHAPFERRPSEPRKSRYRITLPGGRLPIAAVEVEVAGGNVFRFARVTEPRLANGTITPVPLGSAKLKRTERDGTVAAEMVVPVQAPEGRELDLEIDDGNNPPLGIRAIGLRFAPQPWIYFESPDGAPLRARYGSDRALPPLYDLEAYRSYVHTRKAAPARWASAPEPAMTARPAGVTIPPGAKLEIEKFRVSRRLPDAPPGLTSLTLDAHALAHSANLADVRLVDGNGLQIPYLVEYRAEPLALKIPLPARRASGSSSVYRMELPYANLPSSVLVLTTTARVFDRTVTVRRVSDNHRNRAGAVIATAAWRSGEPDLAPPSLRLELPGHTPRGLELLVDEGDNAPLPIESAQLLLPSTALRFEHPGRPLFLVYGNRRAAAPRYDLSLLAPRVFSEPARDLSPGAAPDIPDATDDRKGRRLFWLGVVVAAVVLTLLLIRMVVVRPETSHAP